MRKAALSFVLVALGAPALAAAAQTASTPVQLLVVMGGGTYESSVFGFFDRLDGVEHTLVMSDAEAFAESLIGRYDAVLMYNLSASLDERARGHLTAFLEQGGGLVVLHHALANYGEWPWWYEEVVGGRYLLRPDGDLPASSYRQGESIVAVPQREHPVLAGLRGQPIHIFDETYKGLWISDEVDVLLRTALSTSDGPLVWVGPYDRSRVVVVQPGHSSGAFLNLAFRFIVGDAVRWVAARDGATIAE